MSYVLLTFEIVMYNRFHLLIWEYLVAKTLCIMLIESYRFPFSFLLLISFNCDTTVHMTLCLRFLKFNPSHFYFNFYFEFTFQC